MDTVVALVVAAVFFVAAGMLHRQRGAVLAAMTRWRGYRRTPPGPRRRYQQGAGGTRDMVLPIVSCVLIGTLALIRAALG
jgi:hypothetical protein